MTTPNNPRKYTGTNQYIVPFVTRTRRPTTSDFRQPETGNYYPLGAIWQVGKDPTTGTEGELWSLTKIVSNLGYWVKTASGNAKGPVLTISDTADTLVYPTAAGNLKLEGAAGQVTITSDAANNKLVFSLPGGGGSVDSFTTNVGGPVAPTALGAILVNASTTTFTDGATANTIKTEVQGTNHALFVGRGANTAATNLAVGATGLTLIGATGADPAFAAIGTNSALTTHGVLLAQGNAAFTATAVGTTNTVLLGNTGADPSFGAVPNAALANSSITVTAGTGISVTGSPVSLGGAVTVNVTPTCLLTKFTANGTWNKNARTVTVQLILWGAGGGGGSGRRGAAGTNRGSGGGGPSGSALMYSLDAALLPSSVAVVIGVGGAGGAAVTADDTNGNAGSSGTASSFGNIAISGGGAGGGGTTSGGSSSGQPLVYTTAGQTLLISTSGRSGSTGTPTAANTQTLSLAGCGGGGGGGINSGDTVGDGGAGGAMNYPDSSTALAGGTAGTAGANGGNGNAGNTVQATICGTGGGGGGGSKIAAAGHGGNGGIPGAGGGGGGASLNGFNSGAGGDGGRGEVWVYEFF